MATKPLPPIRLDLDGGDFALLATAAIAATGLVISLERAGLLTFSLIEAFAGSAVGMWLAVTVFQSLSSLLNRPGGAEGQREEEAGPAQN